MNEYAPPPGFVPAPSTIEGIVVFVPAPPDLGPQQEVVEFNCPQCGATTAFSATDGGLTCVHCGYYEAPISAVVGKSAARFEFTVETMERAAQGWGAERKEIECQNCGALTSIPPDSLTHTCPFCGSNKVLQRQAAQDILRPRYLIPFKIEAQTCRNIAREWLGSSWMVPAKLRQLSDIASFSGLYLPFWTFSARTRADWKAEVGHPEVERYYENGEWKQRTVIRWRWESGNVDQTIEDLLVPGTARLSDRLLTDVKNFQLSDMAPYEPKYLAGLQALAYDIPLEKAWDSGRQQMRETTRGSCISQASTSNVRNFSMSLDFADETWRYVLLPVYLATYRYQDKSFQVMVNGQTGQITGQRPADWNKIWLVVAAILSPGVLFCLMGLVTIPFAGIGIGIGAFGFVLLVIGFIIALVLYKKAQELDDI